MTCAEQFFFRLRELGVQLEANQGRLLYDAPQDVLTPEAMEQLVQHKQELLVLVEACDPACSRLQDMTREVRRSVIGLLDWAYEQGHRFAPSSHAELVAEFSTSADGLDWRRWNRRWELAQQIYAAAVEAEVVAGGASSRPMGFK